jgi:hypothetical protein
MLMVKGDTTRVRRALTSRSCAKASNKALLV